MSQTSSTSFKTGVAYYETRALNHVRQDMREIVAHNCTFVVHTFTELDYVYYPKAMKDIVRISREEGLDVYLDPWDVGNVFSGEALSKFVMENPLDCQFLADGRKILPAACLNKVHFRKFMKTWIAKAARTGADTLFWDTPKFHEVRDSDDKSWACRCSVCQKLYYDKYKHEMPTRLTRKVLKFREESARDFMAEMMDYGKKYNFKNALVMRPLGFKGTSLHSWELMASIKSLDIFGTDPYWYRLGKPVEYVGEATRDVLNICEKYNLEPQIWLGIYKVPAGREQEIKRAVKIITSQGIRNISAWSYKGGAYQDNMKSENYELVWKITGEAFAEARKV